MALCAADGPIVPHDDPHAAALLEIILLGSNRLRGGGLEFACRVPLPPARWFRVDGRVQIPGGDDAFDAEHVGGMLSEPALG